MHILFVTRKYPPSTGGMENAAFELYTALAATNDVTLVQWGGTNKALPVVYPWLFMQALWHGLRRRPDVIYLQDGLMGPLGWALKGLLRRPSVITVHGLEATYANPLYRAVVPPFIKRQTAIVTGSSATRKVVEDAFPGVKPKLISYGVNDIFYQPDSRAAQLKLIATEAGIPLKRLQQSKLLHTSGRLVRRKGVLWFVNNVMPQLVADQPVLYLVSGTGKDQEAIEVAITKHGLEESVHLLGRVSDELLHALYNAADIFVMPNIPVANDMEGFGLVSLEAASCGTTVIASELEGIQDAIQNGKNGILLEPKYVTAYVQTIERELRKPSLRREAVRAYTLEHNSWEESARQYEMLMRKLSTSSAD